MPAAIPTELGYQVRCGDWGKVQQLGPDWHYFVIRGECWYLLQAAMLAEQKHFVCRFVADAAGERSGLAASSCKSSKVPSISSSGCMFWQVWQV